jgi:hypothetical protein
MFAERGFTGCFKASRKYKRKFEKEKQFRDLTWFTIAGLKIKKNEKQLQKIWVW